MDIVRTRTLSERWLATIVLIGLLTATAEAQSGKKGELCGQSVFSAEDQTVKCPAKIPEDVLQILGKDERVLRSLEAEDQSLDEVYPAWFLGSEINLDGRREVGLVVLAVGGLRGANITSFWVFRRTPKGHELVLSVSAHTLKVLKTTFKGYRDIRIYSATATMLSTVTFRFDGQKYQEYQSTLEPIR